MTVYALAQLTIHDRERYDRYVERFPPILSKYGGRLLAADDHPDVVEGDWEFQRLVLVAFDDRDQLDRWSSSPEYREIVVDRHGATTAVVLVVRGLGTIAPSSGATVNEKGRLP